MNKSPKSLAQYLDHLAHDASALLAATSHIAEDNVKLARKRLATALDSGNEIFDRVRENAVRRAKVADETVRDNPYGYLIVALILGALIAFLLDRRQE